MLSDGMKLKLTDQEIKYLEETYRPRTVFGPL